MRREPRQRQDRGGRGPSLFPSHRGRNPPRRPGQGQKQAGLAAEDHVPGTGRRNGPGGSGRGEKGRTLRESRVCGLLPTRVMFCMNGMAVFVGNRVDCASFPRWRESMASQNVSENEMAIRKTPTP